MMLSNFILFALIAGVFGELLPVGNKVQLTNWNTSRPVKDLQVGYVGYLNDERFVYTWIDDSSNVEAIRVLIADIEGNNKQEFGISTKSSNIESLHLTTDISINGPFFQIEWSERGNSTWNQFYEVYAQVFTYYGTPLTSGILISSGDTAVTSREVSGHMSVFFHTIVWTEYNPSADTTRILARNFNPYLSILGPIVVIDSISSPQFFANPSAFTRKAIGFDIMFCYELRGQEIRCRSSEYNLSNLGPIVVVFESDASSGPLAEYPIGINTKNIFNSDYNMIFYKFENETTHSFLWDKYLHSQVLDGNQVVGGALMDNPESPLLMEYNPSVCVVSPSSMFLSKPIIVTVWPSRSGNNPSNFNYTINVQSITTKNELSESLMVETSSQYLGYPSITSFNSKNMVVAWLEDIGSSEIVVMSQYVVASV